MNVASSDSGVISRIPRGFLLACVLIAEEMSLCQGCTGSSTVSHRSFNRRNWSLISARSGLT